MSKLEDFSKLGKSMRYDYIRRSFILSDELPAFEAAGQPAVLINLKNPYDLGGECFRREMATAGAGNVLGINPFDQPNVESAKVLAR